MHLFITVGTTKFEALINTIHKNIEDLKKVYPQITVQTGQQTLPIDPEYHVHVFNYKKNLKFDDYDIIVTHCGTGNILNSLMGDKKVVAVCNPLLKDNHQNETKQIFERFVHCVELDNLIMFLLKGDFSGKEKCTIRRKDDFLFKFIG